MGAHFNIQTLNNIASEGLDRMPAERYSVGNDTASPDAILVRSASLLDYSFPKSLKAIARAGAGVNNIPIARCTAAGIVVFNTPGANANAVKELVLAGLLLSSRKIFQGITWTESLKGKGEDLAKLVEKKKSEFQGPEILGKTLGVIGLGAIGMLVANAAEALGMRVIGYDPYISIDSAWKLSKGVEKARSLEALLGTADYLTIHVPLIDSTKNFIDKGKIDLMKNGCRILNFARQELVHHDDILEGLKSEKVAAYVTDFPEESLLGHDKIIPIPHLGASTPESESNCAVMAVDQLMDYLENGNIRNSVNFPVADMPRNAGSRILIANKNIPAMVGKITSILADYNLNIADLINHHRDDLAYNIIDVDGLVNQEQVSRLEKVEGIIRITVLPPVS